jgi:hypothetical protein
MTAPMLWLRRSLLVLLSGLTLAVGLAACGGGSTDGASPEENEPTTDAGAEVSAVPEAESVAETSDPSTELPVDPETGIVTLDAALGAFATLVGPIPGVEPLDPDTPGIAGVTGGGGALRWLAAHLDELTLEQRAAVDALLTPVDGDGQPVPPQAPPAKAAQAPEVPGCSFGTTLFDDVAGAEPYRQMVDTALAALETRLGALRVDTAVGFQADSGPQGTASATAAPWAPDCDQQAVACTILITPLGLQSPADLQTTLAHELVHCYQAAEISIAAWDALQPWRAEGFANWAAAALFDPTSIAGHWRHYLTHPEMPLFDRGYSAFPFYAHVQHVGGDPWATFEPALHETTNAGAFAVTVGDSLTTVADTWAAGLARDPGRGSAWDTDGPGILPDAYEVPDDALLAGDSIALHAAAGAHALRHVAFSADVVGVTATGAAGRIGWDGASDSLVADLSGPWCTLPGGCECPDGSNPAPNAIPADGALFAVSGIAVAASVEVVGASLADLCLEPDISVTVEDGPVDECLVGAWVSQMWTLPGPLPDLDATGGAGVVLDISASGDVIYDFEAMEPVSSYDEQIDVTFATVSRGTSTGQVVATGGTVELLALDESGLVHRLEAGPVSQTIPAGPSSYVELTAADSYTCSGNSFTTTEIDPVERSSVTITYVAL